MFLVLWSHAGDLLPDVLRATSGLNWFRPGFWGVTIFFAISGFLVIGQLLDVVLGQRQETLKVFVLRRWLRTVPTYWILLALLSGTGVLAWLGWSTLALNGLFLQGPMGMAPVLLPVSWSLVIEEWSYLAFAAFAAVLLCCRQRFQVSRQSLVRLFLAVLVVVPMVAGFARFHALEQGVSVQALKQGLLMQTDALVYGGLLAWSLRRLPKQFHSFTRLGVVIAPVVIALICALSATAPELFRDVMNPLPENARGWISFGFYPIAGVLAAAFVAASWQFQYRSLPAWGSRALQVLSRCSYSVYLLHLPFAHFVRQLNLPAEFGLLIYLVGSIVVGDLCWRLLERPFMVLRKRLV